MLSYYLKLAWKSAVRTPGLTVLMVTAIGLGIGVCVTTMTVYHAMSGNPIWWKNDRLYAVTMDSWEAERHSDLALQPAQLTYTDAMALMAAPIPGRRAIMYLRNGILSGGTMQAAPVPTSVRVTTADFFAMFDVPFLYGGPWSAAQDQAAEPLVVLSREQNDRLFGGRNSVGRLVRLGERDFRVTGVLDHWTPLPVWAPNGPPVPVPARRPRWPWVPAPRALPGGRRWRGRPATA